MLLSWCLIVCVMPWLWSASDPRVLALSRFGAQRVAFNFRLGRTKKIVLFLLKTINLENESRDTVEQCKPTERNNIRIFDPYQHPLIPWNPLYVITGTIRDKTLTTNPCGVGVHTHECAEPLDRHFRTLSIPSVVVMFSRFQFSMYTSACPPPAHHFPISSRFET